MSAKAAKRARGFIREWLSRGLDFRGIAIQTDRPVRKVRRERARLKNVADRNAAKARYEAEARRKFGL